MGVGTDSLLSAPEGSGAVVRNTRFQETHTRPKLLPCGGDRPGTLALPPLSYLISFMSKGSNWAGGWRLCWCT